MDTIVIEAVNCWNLVVSTIGADSLIMSATPKNGYTLGLILMVLMSGGGYFILFPRSD
jgi:hypothetical protein